MILEFVPYEDRDEVLLSMYNAPGAPRRGETCYLQLEPGEPYVEHIVEDVEWQVTARKPDELTAIAIVRRKTGFDA